MARNRPFLMTAAAVAMISLDAAVWESNALAMKLSPLDDVPTSGYYIIEENGKETLFDGGKALRVKEQLDGGYTISEDGRTTTVMLDAAGRPVSMDDGMVVVRNVYSEDGLLLSSTGQGGRVLKGYATTDGPRRENCFMSRVSMRRTTFRRSCSPILRQELPIN